MSIHLYMRHENWLYNVRCIIQVYYYTQCIIWWVSGVWSPMSAHLLSAPQSNHFSLLLLLMIITSPPTLPNSSNPFLVLLLFLLVFLTPLLSHALLYFSPLSIVKCVISHPPLSLICVSSGGLRLEKLANWGQPEHLVLTRIKNSLLG